MSTHRHLETKYGFEWNNAEVTRVFSGDRRGREFVVLDVAAINNPKNRVQITVNPGGSITVHVKGRVKIYEG